MSLLARPWRWRGDLGYGELMRKPLWSSLVTQMRSLRRQIQPMEEDLRIEASPEALAAYEEVLSRYKTLVTQAHAGGGPRGIERHVVKNKKVLVRDRIRMLLDPGTEFIELGTLVGFSLPYGDIPMGGLLGGIGRIGGVYCMIGANDATIKAGTYFPITVQKSLRVQEMAEINRLPCIYIPDSGGAFLPLQSLIFINGGRSFYNQAIMSSLGIPQIALVCGSCTAGGAYCPTMSDETIIVDRIGKIFLGGPPLVQAALGEIVSEEELGGAFMHSSVSGCTDYYAQSEEEAFEMCRDIVEGFNLNRLEPNTFSKPAYEIPSMNHFGSRRHLSKSELYSVMGSLLDESRFNEFKAYYGPGLITGLGYIEGMLVGILGNYDEILSAEALKATHFLDLCEKKGIPALFLQNSAPLEKREPGMRDLDVGVLKDRGKLSSAVATFSNPKISLTLTSCHGDDLLLMCGPSFNPNFTFMWPSAQLSFLDMDTPDPTSEEAGILDAFTAGANMVVDEVISPENSRSVIAQCLRIFLQMKLNKSSKLTNKPVFRM